MLLSEGLSSISLFVFFSPRRTCSCDAHVISTWQEPQKTNKRTIVSHHHHYLLFCHRQILQELPIQQQWREERGGENSSSSFWMCWKAECSDMLAFYFEHIHIQVCDDFHAYVWDAETQLVLMEEETLVADSWQCCPQYSNLGISSWLMRLKVKA